MKTNKKILIIDDEKSILESLEILLKYEGYDVTTAMSALAAVSLLEDHNTAVSPCTGSEKGETPFKFDLIISDIKMTEMDGLDFLQYFKSKYSGEFFSKQLPIILMTAYSDVKTAVLAIKEGSFDYIIKPFDTGEFKVLVKKAIDYFAVYDELSRLKNSLKEDKLSGGIVGNSVLIKNIIDEIGRLSKGFTTLLITGESGTGKELAAKLAHDVYFRGSGISSPGPFVPVNLAAIPENLVESELFGYVKGAFTGAEQDKAGLLQYAEGGSLFLDEIGDLPVPVQVKLLRVFQEKKYRKLGSNVEKNIDVRFIIATNKDLTELVRNGSFREDLYFRLNAVHIKMPRLNEHKEDIPLLASHFINKFSSVLNKHVTSITPDAISVLMSYDYHGNVRELENIIERACIYCKGEELTVDYLPDNIKIKSDKENTEQNGLNAVSSFSFLKANDIFNDLNVKNSLSLPEFIRGVERTIAQERLKSKNYSRNEAAKSLGLSLRSLRYILSKYNT